MWWLTYSSSVKHFLTIGKASITSLVSPSWKSSPGKIFQRNPSGSRTPAQNLSRATKVRRQQETTEQREQREIFAGTYFCGSLEKSQKFEPAKISFNTVSLVYLNFVCFVDSLPLFLRKTIRKIVSFVGEKLQRI